MRPTLSLTGFTVGVTAARRRDELAAMLERRGARVVVAPAIRIVPLADDEELLAATRECVRRPPDAVVATTGIGFRGWLEAAEGWGLQAPLVDRLRSARLLARGPKARGALRAAGLSGEWCPESESSAEVLAHLLAGPLAGTRLAVQQHGEPLPDFTAALRAAGAEVVEVPVYRWVPAEDPRPLHRLVRQVAVAGLEAVTFTSAPAVASVLGAARELGVEGDVLAAFNGPVVAACVGPVTAGVLERVGVPTLQPDRFRLGALVRALDEALPARVRPIDAAGHRLELRGHAVLVDGAVRPVSPAALSLLRALARQPGRVYPRTELRAALRDGSADEHAVEMAVNRLRSSLGDPRVVQTVVKRGYRLATGAG